MAYEIPQQLEYKEKIMFGLTFGQLGWALLFGIPALMVLVRKGDIYVNAIISGVIVLIGLIFVFGDVPSWSKYVLNYVKKRKILKTDSRIREVHGIKNITKNRIIADKQVALIEIQSLNFRIKTDQEKESIILAFQKFLNSFDFPIQFVVTTQDLTIDSYLSALRDRVKNKSLFESFNSFITEYIKDNQMKNRRFCLVIPEDGDLNVQCQVVLDRLQSMGLSGKRLKTNQIYSYLNVFFNGFVNERSNHVDDIADVVGLSKIESDMSHLKVNEKYCKIISATGYPRSVESGFLDKIISMEGDFDISIHIEPFNIQTMMVMLNRELQKQRADLYSEELRGSINPSLEIKYADTRKVLEELQKGEEKLFMVSLYINCKANSLKELNLLTKNVESELNSGMIQPQTPLFRQLDGYRSMIPTANNVLSIRRNVPTKALSAFFPFTSPFLALQENGVMLGLNKNKIPVITDIFGLSNPNGLVLATSGAGKSYFTKLLILRQLMNGTKVIIVDPQSEYLDLVESAKGQVVTISRESETIINPLDLMGHDFLEKRLSLMDLFKIMFGDLTDVQKSILDRALTECYKKKKITVDDYAGRKPPLLKDLYKTLEQLSKKASAMEQITYSALLNRLYVYTSGVFNFLNRESSIDFNKDLVCFNIGDMPKQVKPVVMFLILDYVYMKMKQSKDKKLLVIDEAWSLLSQTSEASYIFEIVKTCRKFNMGMLLITQDVADLIDSKAGHAVLANTAYSLLLRQKPAIINDIVKAFSLSKAEKEVLLSATRGSGILISDNEHTEIDIVSSPEEHELITTNPNEKNKVVIEEKPNLNMQDELYLDSELTAEGKSYLMSLPEYKKGEFASFKERSKQTYWVKCTNKESSEHAFHVALIKRELLKCVSEVQDKKTVEADLVFKHKGKNFAIEIETGKNFKYKREEKIKKFAEKGEKYGENLFVVLTDSRMRPHYERIFSVDRILVKEEFQNWLARLFKNYNTGGK